MTPEQQEKRELNYVIQHAAAQIAKTLTEETGCCCATAHMGARELVTWLSHTGRTRQ